MLNDVMIKPERLISIAFNFIKAYLQPNFALLYPTKYMLSQAFSKFYTNKDVLDGDVRPWWLRV